MLNYCFTVFVLSVKYQRFQSLCAYCMQHTDGNKDRTHIPITSQGCELIMSVSVWQLCKQTQETSVPRIRKRKKTSKKNHLNTALTPRSIQTRLWLMTRRGGDGPCVRTDMRSRRFTHSHPHPTPPHRVCSLEGLEARGNKDTPATRCHPVPPDTSPPRGRWMTHSAGRGIPGIRASNRQT